jgi:hypothetical protein
VTHDPVPPEAWAAEGARVAGALDEVAAALVIGRDPGTAFAVALAVALAIARSQQGERRVALGDLVGGLAPLTRDDGAPGLHECFRDGVPLSDIARPLTEDGSVFALPSGNGEIAVRWVFESARWGRLVAGFREVDALLLLIAPPDAPGLAALASLVDGVVAVDLPPTLTRAWPLLATVDQPEPELPPIVSRGTPAPDAGVAQVRTRLRTIAGERARRRIRRLVIAGAVLATALGGGWRWLRAPRVAAANGAPANGTAASEVPKVTPTPPPSAEPADTITLDAVVNPGDEARAAIFAVELVAANTLASANSRLVIRGAAVPAPTLAPVLLGSDGRPWYRALAGAWQERSEADAWLNALRDRGLVRQEVGRVLRVPFALRLVEGIDRADVPAVLSQWTARGVPAYALLQNDGSVRVFAGAFETSGQAVLLARSLRDLGVPAVLAFRTGRTF